MNWRLAIEYIREAGMGLFISKSIRSALYRNDSKLAWVINDWNERIVSRYARRVVNDPNNAIDFDVLIGEPNTSVRSGSIFVMWWQGEEHAPAIVKSCIQSIRRAANGHDVIVISESNVGEYATVPEFILQRLREKKMIFAHFSDMLRLQLLTLYGGCWIDATVFCSQTIPKKYFERSFYSINFGKVTKDPSHGRWTTFLLFAQKDNILIKKTLEHHWRYWKNHQIIIDYIFFDYAIDLVVSECPKARKMIEELPVENVDVFELLDRLDDARFDVKDYLSKSETVFYKLSWKHKFKDLQRAVGILNGYVGV